MRLPNTTHTSWPWRIHRLTADFRLYLLYQARVVVIRGRREGDGERVATVAAGLEDAAR